MRTCSAIILLILAALPVCAQEPLQRRTTHAAPQYTLGAGDQFVIQVQDLQEISQKTVRIDPGGFVDLPLAGRLEAAGLTLEQFKAQVGSRLAKYINNPEISITLTESGNQPVSVVGEVSNPGVHQLAGSRRLLEVISLSGGLKPTAGPTVLVTREAQWGPIDAPHVKVDPATQSSTASFSIDSLMASAKPEENIVIEPNDVISIPRAELIYVVGDVKKAGGFQLSTHPTMSVLQALSLAEGLGPDDSAKHAHVLRRVADGDGTPRDIPVDVQKIFAGKAPDMPLFANDVLFIPRSGMKVTTRRALDAAIGVSTGLLIYR